MNTENPLVKLERYSRIRNRRQKIMQQIANKIYELEKDYVQVEFRGIRRFVIIHQGRIPYEDRMLCKRLRYLYTKLENSVLQLKEKIYCIRKNHDIHHTPRLVISTQARFGGWRSN